MDINVDLTEVLMMHRAALECEAQMLLEREIQTEMSASKTEEQQNHLRELLKYGRVNVEIGQSTVTISIHFYTLASKGMEDYASMVESNAYAVIEPTIYDSVSEYIHTEEARNMIADQCRDQIANEIQNMIGGIT